jgi:hypothetical protein
VTKGLPRRTIELGMNRPVNYPAGTMPDMSSALLDYFQPMEFTTITKGVQGFEAIESGVVTSFRGVIMPFKPRNLELKPIGQRAWTYWQVFSDRVLPLQVDDIITLPTPDPAAGGALVPRNSRVMSRMDWSRNGYFEFVIAQDWTGSNPLT